MDAAALRAHGRRTGWPGEKWPRALGAEGGVLWVLGGKWSSVGCTSALLGPGCHHGHHGASICLGIMSKAYLQLASRIWIQVRCGNSAQSTPTIRGSFPRPISGLEDWLHHQTRPVATHRAGSGARSKTATVTAEMAVSRDILRNKPQENTLLSSSSDQTEKRPPPGRQTVSRIDRQRKLSVHWCCSQGINSHGHVPAQLRWAAGPVRRPFRSPEEETSSAQAGCKAGRAKEGPQAQAGDRGPRRVTVALPRGVRSGDGLRLVTGKTPHEPPPPPPGQH